MINAFTKNIKELVNVFTKGGNDGVAFVGTGDFLVDGRYSFEVGGKGKRFNQIADIPDSYVVSDDVENTIGNKIPLWLLGFLY